MNRPYRLWHGTGTRSLRVLWTAEELGVRDRIEIVPVEFPPRLRQPAYLDVNPLGSLPFFTHDDVRFDESMAACQYLAARHATPELSVRADDPAYGAYLRFCWFGEATLMQPLGALVRQLLMRPPGTRDEAVVAEARTAFAVRDAIVAAALGGGGHLAAGRLTLADVSVGYALDLAAFLDVALLSPATAAYLDRLRSRPAFAAAASWRP